MRWLTFSFFAMIAWVLQTTLAGRVTVLGVGPDWVFVLVVFFALYARRTDGFLAGWALGLGTDLMSIERLGLLSLGYGMTALLVGSIRHLVFLKSAWTHFAVTLMAGFVLQAYLGLYRVFQFPLGSAGPAGVFAEGAMISVYTAAWAPIVHYVLLRFSRGLGLHTSRYHHSGLLFAGQSRV